jgi:hypothetical protein
MSSMKRSYVPIATMATLIALLVIAFANLSAGGSTLAGEEEPLLQYPASPPTPTIGAPPQNAPLQGPAAPKSAAVALKVDTFDTPASLADWTFVDLGEFLPGDEAVWKVEEGRLEQRGTGLAGGTSAREVLAVTGDPAWSDYIVSAKVYDLNAGNFGLVARRQGNSFYRYQAIADERPAAPKHVLEVVVDGVATPLVVLDGPGYQLRTWNDVSMRVAGQQITVWVDGQPILSATDATLSSGQAGVFARALDSTLFDDVTITSP